MAQTTKGLFNLKFRQHDCVTTPEGLQQLGQLVRGLNDIGTRRSLQSMKLLQKALMKNAIDEVCHSDVSIYASVAEALFADARADRSRQ